MGFSKFGSVAVLALQGCLFSSAFAGEKADKLVLEALKSRENDCAQYGARVYPQEGWVDEYVLKQKLAFYVISNKYLPCKRGDSDFDNIEVDSNGHVFVLERGSWAMEVMHGGLKSYKVVDGKRPKVVMTDFDGSKSTMDFLNLVD